MTESTGSRPLRVAMLIGAYPPHLGGAELQLASLAPLLSGHGVDVHVLTRRPRNAVAFEHKAGVAIRRLPAPGPKALASVSYTTAALMHLRRLAPDVVHAHGLFSPATTALAARRLWGTPVLAKPLRSGVLGDINRLRCRATGKWRLAAFARELDAFAVVSEAIDGELGEIGVPAERRLRLPNGVDTRRFGPADAAERAAQRRRLRLPSHPLVVFAGRLAREKGLSELLECWPQVRAGVSDATLLILGSGPERDDLERRAGAGVVFAGAVNDVHPYLACADVFVLPSRSEGLSNALLEAMAVGLPVLTTAVGGAVDVVRHRESGWLVPAQESSALVQGLLALLTNRELAADLGRRARTYVMEHHDLVELARRLSAVYRLLAERRPLPAAASHAGASCERRNLGRDSR